MVSGESMAESYEVRMRLPKDLAGVQGLCVGFYNEESKKLEVLDSHVEGDYIVFVTDRITDFVIFGDPTVSLTAAIAILGATLLLQIIAILFLLICRKKSAKKAKSARTYAFAPIVALTIRFAPVNGLAIAVALAAAVVVTTVILIWLLLTTEIVRHDDREEVADDEPTPAPTEESVPYGAENTDVREEGDAMSIFDEPQDSESDPVLTTLTDVEIDGHPEDAEAIFRTPYAVEEQGYRYSYETDGEVDDEEAETTESEEAVTEESDPFAVYDEAEEGNYDFIEPAIDPRYSLPDEASGGRGGRALPRRQSGAKPHAELCRSHLGADESSDARAGQSGRHSPASDRRRAGQYRRAVAGRRRGADQLYGADSGGAGQICKHDLPGQQGAGKRTPRAGCL